MQSLLRYQPLPVRETHPTPTVLTHSGRRAKGGAMTSIDTAIAAHPSYRWARVSLVLIAAIELLDALSSVQGIFTEYHHETALLRFAQGINSIKLALSPCSLARRWFWRHEGIFATRFLLWPRSHLRWLLDSLPTIVIHGFKPSLDFGGIEEFVFSLIMPVIAAAAILLAAKRQRLGLAEGDRELASNYQHRHRPTIGGSTRHDRFSENDLRLRY